VILDRSRYGCELRMIDLEPVGVSPERNDVMAFIQALFDEVSAGPTCSTENRYAHGGLLIVSWRADSGCG
jgi:hypothetical protein